jgi:hypothetical protein
MRNITAAILIVTGVYLVSQPFKKKDPLPEK